MINPAMHGETIRRRRTSSILALAGRLLTARLAERLRPLGLGPAQYLVLNELWDDRGLTQRALIGRLGVEQATMAATLKRMERDGFITRHRHPDDDRARIIRLTPRARALEAQATAIATSIDRDAMALLTPDGEEAVRALLLGLVAGLGDASDS